METNVDNRIVDKIMKEYLEKQLKENDEMNIKTIPYLDNVEETDRSYEHIKREKLELLKWQKTTLKKEKTNQFLIELISGSLEDDEILIEEKETKRGRRCYNKYKVDLLEYKVDFLLKNGFFLPDNETNENKYSGYKKNLSETLFALLFSRSAIKYINMIEKYYPGKIHLNSYLLEKIVVYGRYKVLEFLISKYPHLILKLVNEKNPYEISKDTIDHDYEDDIWNGWTWGNDEWEKPVIKSKDRDFDKTFEILECLARNNKTLIDFSDDIKKRWITFSIYNNNKYHISYLKLLTYFGLETIKTKQDVIKLVELVGSAKAWKIINCKSHEILEELLK